MKIQIFHLVKSNRFSPGNYVMERLRDFSLSDLDLRFYGKFLSLFVCILQFLHYHNQSEIN